MKRQKSFTLVEVIVGTFLMLIIFLGIFGAYRLGLKVTGLSKNRVTAVAIANEELEELRNLPYASIDSFSTTTILNNVQYQISVISQCIDGQEDGKAPNDENNCICDYKKVKAKVSWPGIFKGSVALDNIISPRNKVEECEVPAGVLEVSTFNAQGNMVDSPAIEVENINSGEQYYGNEVSSGVYEFVVPPATSTYSVTTTKTNYTLSRTYQSGEVYNGQTIANPANECWAHPIASVFNAQRTEYSFCIDKTSRFLVKTLEAKAKHIYYVRKTGSDNNDGLSPDSAFLTIQKAASTAQAGDFVFVGAGSYEERVEIENSGTASDPISFVADASGGYTGDSGKVNISGGDVGFYINAKSHINIYGFNISNTTGTAAIYINGSGASDINLVDNDISDNKGSGVSIEAGSNILLSRNLIYANGGEGILLSNGASGCQIKNNLLYLNTKSGISLSGNSTGNAISDNTCFKNQENGILIENSSNNQIDDNIIASSTLAGIKVATSTNIQNKYNDLWANSPNYEGITAASSSISADPLFIDSDHLDLRLSQTGAGQATTSPCVDAGSDTAANLDMDDKTTRTDNIVDQGTVDIGFHYSLSGSSPAEPDPFGQPIDNTSFDLRGEKSVGTDSNESPIYKYSTTSETDSKGELTLNNMEWDNYHFSNFSSAGISLDLIISYPSPAKNGETLVSLSPDSTTTVKLGLKAENTLLVNVLDASTSEPISFAEVRVYKSDYDKTKITGDDGQAYFIPLEKDSYHLSARAENYSSTTISVLVDGHTTKDIKLEKE